MIKDGSTVKVHYTGRLLDGQQFDSSYERQDPLQFTVGQNEVISGFENALIGKTVGEKATINISVDEAYGPHNPSLVVEVDKSQIPGDVQVGDQLQAQGQNGQPLIVKVVEVLQNSYKIDGNHPLAGLPLVFDVEVVEIN